MGSDDLTPAWRWLDVRGRVGSMLARLLLATIVLTATAHAAHADAGPVQEGGPRLQASMYERTLEGGESPLQVLVRLCEVPEFENRCEPMPDGLRHAIAGAVDLRIRWVHRKWPHAGQYWVLSPIRFMPQRAVFAYSWRDQPVECWGDGRIFFRRTPGGWAHDGGGSGSWGCV